MCVDRPVEVVRVGCEDISLDKCITVPDIVTEVETSEVRGRIYICGIYQIELQTKIKRRFSNIS